VHTPRIPPPRIAIRWSLIGGMKPSCRSFASVARCACNRAHRHEC